MKWRQGVQLAPEYITQMQSVEGLECGYRRQANQDGRKRRIKMKIRSRNANPEKSKTKAGGSGVEATGGGMTGEPTRMGGVPGKRIGGKDGVPGSEGEPLSPACGSPEGRSGKNPVRSPGENVTISGGTKIGSDNSSLVGSAAAVGFIATGDSRLAQRTRERFSPSVSRVSPAGINMRFLVQNTRWSRRYETNIDCG